MTGTPYQSIGLIPGADQISHSDIAKDWFPGWSAEWPEGPITWRVLFPDGFPKSEIWSGQISVGAASLMINGKEWEIEGVVMTPDQLTSWEGSEEERAAAAVANPDAPETRRSAENTESRPAPTPWTLHRLGAQHASWIWAKSAAVTSEEVKAAEDVIQGRLIAVAKQIHAEVNHEDALLWGQAYAWSMMLTRKQFSSLWDNKLKGAAYDIGESRRAIREQCYNDPWQREDLRSLTRHPRQEVRSLAVEIINERSRRNDPEHQARLAAAREAGANSAAMQSIGDNIGNAAASKQKAAHSTEQHQTDEAPTPTSSIETAPVVPSPVRR